MSYKTYDAGETGSESARSIDEKPIHTDGCPQRGTRPSLDLSPEGDDFYTGHTFSEKANASACNEDYNDLPAIDNNEPVAQRKSWDFHEHGWRVEPNEALPSGESGATNASNQKPRKN